MIVAGSCADLPQIWLGRISASAACLRSDPVMLLSDNCGAAEVASLRSMSVLTAGLVVGLNGSGPRRSAGRLR
jgi:hypothetical protein